MDNSSPVTALDAFMLCLSSSSSSSPVPFLLRVSCKNMDDRSFVWTNLTATSGTRRRARALRCLFFGCLFESRHSMKPRLQIINHNCVLSFFRYLCFLPRQVAYDGPTCQPSMYAVIQINIIYDEFTRRLLRETTQNPQGH